MNHEPREHRLELSPIQVTGSALAAMSGAFFASWAGVAGTIVGAALASVVVTVGAATYTWSLQRTRDAVQRTAAQVRQAATVPGRTAGEKPAAPELVAEEPADRRWNLPWGKLALTSVAVMALGLGGITAIEAVAGKPVSALTGSSSSTGTTLGSVVGSGSGTTGQPDSGTSGADTSDPGDSGTQTPTPTTEAPGASGDDETGGTAPTPATPTPSTDPAPSPTPGPGDTDDTETPSPDPEPSTQP
ncbi:MAG: hypothetical protein ABWY19_07220 [Marmoricola sp.]